VSLWLLPVSDGRADIGDGILWGGSTHETEEELGAWLAERGASYATWAERHPAAAVRIEGEEEASPRELPPPVETPLVTVQEEEMSLAVVIALALAGALLASALLPRALLPAALARPYEEWRLAAAGGGIAVIVGLAVVVLAGTR
jgi:hypothetical protein